MLEGQSCKIQLTPITDNKKSMNIYCVVNRWYRTAEVKHHFLCKRTETHHQFIMFKRKLIKKP